jgi:hypothetical protein
MELAELSGQLTEAVDNAISEAKAVSDRKFLEMDDKGNVCNDRILQIFWIPGAVGLSIQNLICLPNCKYVHIYRNQRCHK